MADVSSSSALWKAENGELVLRAINAVFRRLLANLLLDFDNPKFREIRVDNGALQRNTEGVSPALLSFFFDTLHFKSGIKDGFYVFDGTREDLQKADATYSRIEDDIEQEKLRYIPVLPSARLKSSKEEAEQRRREVLEAVANDRSTTPDTPATDDNQGVLCQEDFDCVDQLRETVRHTLLNTGRVRNCFFDAKDFTVRRMLHGRVYACSEKCSTQCLEAHWHLFSGKGLVYAYVAHLTENGETLLHRGNEYGYQYNSIPGTQYFGQTVLFNEKRLTEDGHLVYNKNLAKPCDACIYCGTPFSKLFLTRV